MFTDKHYSNKIILLSDEIDTISIKDVVEKILEINHNDNLNQKKYRYYKRKPIKLYINSYGGVVYDGLALVDTIRYSKTPVHTYCFGSAMSMGLWIYLAGKRRYAGRNCTFMYHEISNAPWGKLSFIKQEVDEMQRLQRAYDDMITKNTKIRQEKLDEIKEKKAEWYIAASEALKLGICHGII